MILSVGFACLSHPLVWDHAFESLEGKPALCLRQQREWISSYLQKWISEEGIWQSS